MSLVSLIFWNSTLRLIVALLFLLGALFSSLFPYQSLVALKQVHLSNFEFALTLVLASIVTVVSSIFLGILSDRKTNRRALALGTVLTGASGLALMTFFPSQASEFLFPYIRPIDDDISGRVDDQRRHGRADLSLLAGGWPNRMAR